KLKTLRRHSRESGNLEFQCRKNLSGMSLKSYGTKNNRNQTSRIPARAGMTISVISICHIVFSLA
ncbi:hypothetical protein, partial [Neisseria meningitidis]|uniref:hypothetical protein n=1 Tax=Neisseria meningitidis TaxID=487 RepID=UPI001C8F7A41